MLQTVYFVTGAGRGMGLEYVRQLLSGDERSFVVGGVRDINASDELKKLKEEFKHRLEIVQLDVTDQASIDAAVKVVEGLSFVSHGLDVLINVAGVLPGWDDALSLSIVSDLKTALMVNTVGPAAVTHAFLPLLRKGEGKKVWNITSDCASLSAGFSNTPGAAAYSVSKVGLNMFAVKLARALEKEGGGWVVVNLHPGHVKTDMTSSLSLDAVDDWMSPKESVEKSLAVFRSKTVVDSGCYVDFTGKTCPW